MRVKLWIGLVGILMLSPVLAVDLPVDWNATFMGPFAGAQAQSEMAQSFEMSVSGFLHGMDAYVPMNSGPSCEFTWYLRDGATLDPESPDILALPVLASGTGMTDTPAAIYQAAPSILLRNANVPVTAGDLLVLHIVRDCSFLWIAGAGLLPGDRYEFNGTSWAQAGVANLELGRTIYASDTELAVDDVSWGLLKGNYR
jgi:hypothetical protein